MLADITATVLTDDRTPADGQAKLRVFHASPSAPPAVDVAVTDGPVLVDGLTYPEATGYLTVDPGAYALEVRAAGETDAALSLNATLDAGQNYTAIALDGGEAGVQIVLAMEAQAAMPNTAMDASPTSPLVPLGLLLVALATGQVVRLARRPIPA